MSSRSFHLAIDDQKGNYGPGHTLQQVLLHAIVAIQNGAERIVVLQADGDGEFEWTPLAVVTPYSKTLT